MSVGGPVHVLVGLIDDSRGRWLVNRRRVGTHMAGFWEFPGGKRAVGEEPFDALRRELNEELGIEVLHAEPFTELVHDYPDRRVRLDVWRVLSYRGNPQPREGQELKWLDTAGLRAVGMLPADEPLVAALAEAARALNRAREGIARPD
jgi:8-oxo-dGTP diphosphatase